MADCRSYLGFLDRGEWATDDEDTWRAMAGTSLHEWWRNVRLVALARPDVSFELEVEYGGVVGHVDEMDWGTNELTDYKFPRLASARVWDDPDVLEEKFVQGQGYAAGVMAHPLFEEYGLTEPPLVRMLVMPVDGKFDDWRVYERPFDREVADRALDRLAYVREVNAAGGTLPRDKQLPWCENWCEFYQACRGGEVHGGMDLPLITDEEVAAAVERYGQALEVESAAAQVKKEVAPLLRGARGVARGYRVFTTKAGEGKNVLDEAKVRAEYVSMDRDVPERWQPGRAGSLRVIKVKGDK